MAFCLFTAAASLSLLLPTLRLDAGIDCREPRNACGRRIVMLAAPAPAVADSFIAERRGNLALLDEPRMLDAQNFPIAPDDLIARAKDFIAADYGAEDPGMLADAFSFVGPFIGPLSKQQYIDALGGKFNPADGFPDLIGRQFGFSADPIEPGRVWWVSRPVGTFSRPFFGAEPDGRRIETPPQAMGCVFDAAGKVTRINVGAVIDRTQGNTAGLGGLFGFLWFVGKAPPAPEYRPFKKSWQFELLEKLGPLLTKLQAARR